jgi:hypothetical protein
VLDEIKERPLFAHVAKSNVGSVRVLEKCGFTVARENLDGDVAEWVMKLYRDTPLFHPNPSTGKTPLFLTKLPGYRFVRK